MSGKFLKLGVLGLSLFGLFNSFLILLHFQGLNSQNFILSEKLKEADVDFNYDLARIYLNDGDPETAKIYFVDSINANPLNTISLVDLSEIYLDQDNYEQAEILLRRAHFLSPYAFKLIWRMAILSLWIDQKEFALTLLNTISKVDSGKVFDLSWRVFDDKELIFNQMVNQNNIRSYLLFLIQKNKIQESFQVWNRMGENNLIDEEIEIRYMDFLIKNDEFIRAGKIWNDKQKNTESSMTIWNGGFERKPVQYGFGWIIKRKENVYIGYDWEERKEGKYSLFIEFNGKENIEFRNITKIVPVKPEHEYNFSYFIKTDDLTTQNGIYWNINCYPNSRIYHKKTENITGTINWKKFNEKIFIPEDCNAIRLKLLRDRSKKLDKFISGKVWIDDVDMRLIKNEIN